MLFDFGAMRLRSERTVGDEALEERCFSTSAPCVYAQSERWRDGALDEAMTFDLGAVRLCAEPAQ